MSNELSITGEQTLANTNMGFMIAHTLKDAKEISEIIATSGVCPMAYKNKPNDVLVAIQMGAELGLKPMQALQNITVINGRPSVWGDAMLAICRLSKQFTYIKERYNKDDNSYTCTVKRGNEPEFISSFSEADARKANLWGKQGPWTQYPKRMLQMRARGFCLRDSFPDLLRGIITTEEAQDIAADYEVAPTDAKVTHTIEPEHVAIISLDQLYILKDKMQQANSKEEDICKFASIEKLEDMPVSAWNMIVRMLDKKILEKVQNENLKNLTANKAKPQVDKAVSDFFGPEKIDEATGEVVQ